MFDYRVRENYRATLAGCWEVKCHRNALLLVSIWKNGVLRTRIHLAVFWLTQLREAPHSQPSGPAESTDQSSLFQH